jgi:hypothetical protein
LHSSRPASLADPVHTGITAVLDTDVAATDDEGLLEGLAEIHQAEARLAACKARVLGEIDARGAYASTGAQSAAAWLAHHTHTPTGRAHHEVRVARALRHLPATFAALADGTVLTPREVAALLDPSVVERVVFDGPSRVMDIGHQRLFKGALRRAIQVRDRSCTHKLCDAPIDRCDVDHVEPWDDGGLTTQENGRLLCPFHDHLRQQRPPP